MMFNGHTILTFLFALSAIVAFGQRPVIHRVDRTTPGPGTTVSITGNSFGNDASKLAVSFGGMKGSIQFASDQLIEVSVPNGATYDEVVVTYLPSGLSARSDENILMSFGGNPGITGTSFDAQLNFPAESGLYDLCSCDFDGDGKLDIATANQSSNSITLLKNRTTGPGQASINFEKQNFLINANTIHALCGDISGDGKPDLIFSDASQSSDKLYFLKNTSTGPNNFGFATTTQSVPGKKVKQIKLADLDGDGRQDIVITAQNSNSISILSNQSTGNAISFASVPVQLNNIGTSSIGTDGVDLHDLNGDGLPEIVSSKFQNQDRIFIHRNTSTVGNISFAAPESLNIVTSLVNIRIGDLDGDTRPDIAVTQLVSSDQIERVVVFLNQSTGGSVTFSNPQFIASGQRFWGLDFGDLDGDRKADIVVCSITRKELTILKNNSTPGSLNFQANVIATEFVTRHVSIGDIDGDARPDIAFTSIDFNDIPASKVSIFRNKICQQPMIEPTEPENICDGTPFQLFTIGLPGTTYVWDKSGTQVKSGPDAFVDVTVSGEYTVTAQSPGCTRVSESRILRVQAGALSEEPTLEDPEPLCVGSTLQLEIDPLPDANVRYEWTGPAGYAGLGFQPEAIQNFQQTNAGRYDLKIFVDDCLARELSTVVEAISLEGIQINSGTTSIVCAPDTKTLSVSPVRSDFTYQWLKNNAPIPGASGTSLNATETASYSVAASYTPNPSCAAIESAPVEVKFAEPIIADFEVPDFSCTGQQVTFVNQTDKDPSLTTHYSWTYGNSQTGSTKDGITTYLTAASFSVKLVASYDNGACADEQIKPIIVKTTPTVILTATDNRFSFCHEGETELRVTGIFSSYEWNTSETGPAIRVSEPGIYSVEVMSTNGCVGRAEEEIIELDPVQVELSASPGSINEGETTELSVSGLEEFLWSPSETLSDPSAARPIATPSVNTIYKVEGTDENGCFAKDSIQVVVNSGSIYPKLTPLAFFSPNNGDDIGNFWTVDRVDEFPGCQVTVYDDKGVQVFAAKPYANNWDGTVNGKPLPDGVYYFIIKCDGDKNPPRTGSITLLR